MRTPFLLLTTAGLLGVMTACSDAALTAGDEAAFDTDWSETPDASEDTDAGVGLPSEDESDFLAMRPAQTDVYVFVANPGRGTVTRVNVETLEVRTTEVGNDPRLVLTTHDYQTAVVFNRGDNTVTLLDSATLEGTTVPVRANLNSMALSPDGAWAVLWHDENAVRSDDPAPQGLQSFNEVSFVDVHAGTHTPMIVDYDPKGVEFTPDGRYAVVVSDESLALVDLLASPLSPTLIPVTDDFIDPPVAEEVEVVPDGSYAFVRQRGTTDLVVVDLVTRDVERVPVGQDPTDLDLTPDGQTAVVVARGSRELYLIDAADPLADAPRVLDLPEAEPFGSVQFSPTGDKAVLYTTASLIDRYATWDVETDAIQLRPLVKPVKGVSLSPTGETLLVFHTQANAPDASPTSPFTDAWALTLIDLDDFRSNPLRLPAEPTGYVNASNGLRGYFIMEGEPWLEVLDYQTLLSWDIPLRSDPVFVGVLPDLDDEDGDEPPAWVSQEHDLGRISFYDPDDDSLETITGFELNSQIED